jgi:hypothetical protein
LTFLNRFTPKISKTFFLLFFFVVFFWKILDLEEKKKMFFFLQELFLSFCFSLNNSFLFRVTKVTEKGVACDKSVVFVVLR